MATQWQTNPMRNSVEITPIQVQKKQKSILPPFDYKPKELVDTVKELRIELQVDQPIQITSGKVTGSLTLHCFKEQRVGRILVYLCGVEQQAKEKRVFLQKSWVVQESHLVPGEAVYPSPPDEHGMWKSKVQSTKFEFSIPFKETVDNIKTDIDTVGPLPSSYYYPKVGGIRYFVIGLVDSKDVNQKKPRKPLAIFKELLVLESVPFSLTNQFDNSNPLNSVLEQTMTKQIKTGLFGLGKPVEIHLGAKVWTLSMDGQVETGVWQSGTTGYVKVSIENQTNKPLNVLQVSLVRVIKTFAFKDNEFVPDSYSKKEILTKRYDTRKISNNVWDKHLASHVYRETKDGYKSNDSQVHWYGVQPQTATTVTVNLPVHNLARTIRHGSSIDVSFEVLVSVDGLASLTIPVTILHPLSFVETLPGQTKTVLYEPPMSVSQSVVAGVLGLGAEPQFVSNVTLQEVPDFQEDTRSVATSTFRNRLAQKPKITSPSPVSLQARQSIKKPVQDAPSILSRGAKRTSYDVESNPVDLNEEMDKLYQMIQTTR